MSAAEKRVRSTIPPGPRPIDFLRVQYEFLSCDSQVDFFSDLAQKWGGATSFWLGTFRTYLFTDPDLIERVVMDREGVFSKDAMTHELEDLLGQGLLTAEGDHWRRQRKLAAPALKRKQIEAYADWMVELTEREMEAWSDGDEIELHHAMMQLTLKIVVKTLFNMEMEGELATIGQAIDDVMDVFYHFSHTLWRFVPEQIPTPLRRKFERTSQELDDVIYNLIRRRRESGEEGDDLLWRFIVATDDDGAAMTDEQLRDEAITIFLAGHETTALAVTYAWFLLSKNPEVAQKLFAELDDVLGDRRATAADVQGLPYLKAVIQETLRLYSPAWIIGREAMEDTEVGGYFVPKGTQVLAPQAVVHRDEKYFPEPDRFRPERWLDPAFEKSIPRFAYFPFGGGPRVCIGNHFALMEAMLLVATMAQSFDLENVMTGPLVTQPAVTLRPTVPVSMRVRVRQPG